MKHIYFTLIIVLLLSACGAPTEPPMPTQDIVQAAYTFAAQTVQAGAQTSTPAPAALSPVVTSALATSTPWFAPPTFTFVPATPVCQDRAQFIGGSGLDQSIYKPNEKFVVTWTLMNVGTCVWDQYYDLVFANQGDQLGAPPSMAFIPINGTVKPGETVNVSMSFTAPAVPGVYQSLWSLVDGYGSVLPVQNGFTDSALYTEIEVSAQVGKTIGRIIGVQLGNFELSEGLQCGDDAVYLLIFKIAADGPVTANIHFTTQPAGAAAENGFLDVVDDTIVFTEAGVQAYTLTVWGPYQDPAHVTVSAILGDQVYGSYTIPCQ